MSFVLRRSLLLLSRPNYPIGKCTRSITCYEHQGLELLKKYNVPVPQHVVVKDVEKLVGAIKEIGGDDFVIKALVQTGGRGLGVFDSGLKGGVQTVCSQDEAKGVAKRMLGYKLITKQTGENGILCEQLLLAKRHFLRREYYFSIALDRAYNGPVMIACGRGGTSIEDIAKQDPEAIVYLPVDVEAGLADSAINRVLDKIGVTNHCQSQALDMIKNMYNLFVSQDCTMLEINPLAEDSSGNLLCMDCKITLDDASFYRHRNLFESFKPNEASEQEILAKENNLNFIPLQGSIGCLVNGAGLAMATMDIIKLHGGEPANFLDVGGGASIDQVKAAFRIISQDPKVRAVLVNIFGGILRCDVIATGVCQAAKDLNIKVPIVCRLMGTKVDDAKALIASSDLKVLAVDNLDEAAKMAVRLASIMDMAREVAVGVKFELPI